MNFVLNLNNPFIFSVKCFDQLLIQPTTNVIYIESSRDSDDNLPLTTFPIRPFEIMSNTKVVFCEDFRENKNVLVLCLSNDTM